MHDIIQSLNLITCCKFGWYILLLATTDRSQSSPSLSASSLALILNAALERMIGVVSKALRSKYVEYAKQVQLLAP